MLTRPVSARPVLFWPDRYHISQTSIAQTSICQTCIGQTSIGQTGIDQTGIGHIWLLSGPYWPDQYHPDLRSVCPLTWSTGISHSWMIFGIGQSNLFECFIVWRSGVFGGIDTYEKNMFLSFSIARYIKDVFVDTSALIFVLGKTQF